MPEEYIVRQGDCLSSIAYERKFTWETIWDHPNNAALKRERKDPNILKEGDKLFIPDKELKEYICETEQRHRFQLIGTPARLRLRIVEEMLQPSSPNGNESVNASLNPVYGDSHGNQRRLQEHPCARVPYLLNIDGNIIRGNADSNGMIQRSIPPNAKEGRLILEPGTLKEREILLNLGHLDPITKIGGIKHRLRNLGFNPGEINDEETKQLRLALQSFQEKYGLQQTCEADDATCDKLRQLHGS